MQVIIKRLFYRGTGSGGGGGDASDIAYDNGSSGLPATNVQQAIDALSTSLDGKSVSFTSGSWLGPDLDNNYTITIANTVHNKQNPDVTVFEEVSGEFVEVETMITLDASANIKLSIPSIPDLRFTGKITIS